MTKLHLSSEEIGSLNQAETELLFKLQTAQYNDLNQTIDNCVFSVISELSDLKKLAEEMKNAAYHYRNKILLGEYLILTINNGIKNEFTNFGLRIEDSQLIFDDGVKLRLKQNEIAPDNISQVFQKYAQNNKIIIPNER